MSRLCVVIRVRKYAAPSVPLLVRFIAMVAWLTSISIVALVPIDVWTTLNHTSTESIVILWMSCYWCVHPICIGRQLWMCCMPNRMETYSMLPIDCRSIVQDNSSIDMVHHPDFPRMQRRGGLYIHWEVSKHPFKNKHWLCLFANMSSIWVIALLVSKVQ